MLKNFLVNNKYLICAGLSTFSLGISAITTISISNSVNQLSKGFEPLSEWAETQNECITRTFRINGNNTQGIPSKVWSCNGGGN
tara:strand:+ start:1109 stop:1360 length:252 start_codon:yes stop_codon:yes gene_type:complete